jgi:hypothetical protein
METSLLALKSALLTLDYRKYKVTIHYTMRERALCWKNIRTKILEHVLNNSNILLKQTYELYIPLGRMFSLTKLIY